MGINAEKEGTVTHLMTCLSPATSDVRTYAPDTENSGSPLTTGLQRREKPESVLAAHTAIPLVSTSTPATNSLLSTSASDRITLVRLTGCNRRVKMSSPEPHDPLHL